jgi:CheY-like chemotaxis protein
MGEGELLPLLSHELRAPLATILLWTQLLREGSQDPADADRALGMIERGVRSLEQVADDILDLSRIAAGTLILDTSPTDLAELVSGALEQAREAAEQKGVEIVYAAAVPRAIITGDPPRLRRALARLLGLALKSTPRGGRVEVRLDHEGEQARVAISDTGIGFGPPGPPGQPQGQDDRSRAQRSIELGLSLARHVVGLHGGRLEAGGRGEGQGGRLVMTLPRGQPAEASPEPDPTPGPGRLSGTRVLVVEDDDDSREGLKIILERWGATVATAASAGEALERLKAFRPHVLLSDLAMPGEDGYSLIRRVRSLEAHEGGRTPAAALTAFARPDDRERALAAGYQRHVSKPLDPADLFAVVAALARAHP